MNENLTLNIYNDLAKRVRAGLTQPTSLNELHPILNELIGAADPEIYRDSVHLTSSQASALLRGDEEAYKAFSSERDEIPDVSNLSFAEKLKKLPPYNHLSESISTLGEQEVISMISRMIDGTSRLFPEHVYIPFFQKESIDSQIDIFPLIEDLKMNLRTTLGQRRRGIESNDRLKIFNTNERPQVEVIDSITYGNLLPTSIAASNNSAEFDSDEVNLMQVTSFGRGDKVVLLATYGDYALATSGDGYGWINIDQVASIDEQKIIQNAKVVYYKGGEPIFYTDINREKRTLLPGDTVYEDSGQYYILQRNEKTKDVSLYPIDNLSSEKITEKLETPQELLDFLYGLDVPYIRGIFDCSEIYRRAFKLLGYQVGKYSGRIMRTVEQALGFSENERIIEDFSYLSDGIYLSNILDGTHSKHVSLLVITNGQIEVYSYTHDQEDPAYEYPHILGRHIVETDLYKQKIGSYKVTALPLTA